MRRLTACLVVFLLLGVARAEEPATVELVAPTLRLVPVIDGLRSQKGNRDLQRTKETGIYKTAKKAGVDLEDPPHPLVAASYREGRLFYVFYKVAESAIGDRPYILQRIKKTERTWPEEGSEPDVRVTYQVEVFKTFGGAVKRSDQHHGSYGLRDAHRREIVKEYEIGIGEVPGVCEGTDWPYDQGRLFEYIHRYAEDKGPFDDVRFLASTTWSLVVELDASGSWRVLCPELGFDAPAKMPALDASTPKADPASKKTVLVRGRGTSALKIGRSNRADLDKRLGAPLKVTTFPAGTASLCYPGALVANLDEAGKLKSLTTGPGFGGRTKEGLAHGDDRWRVAEVLGLPEDQDVFGWTWRYEGVMFWFDGFERVRRISIR